jgi:hypothetical protein
MNTTTLRDAYDSLLNAAAEVADSLDPTPDPPAGEWNADQILSHVALVNAATITAISTVASGIHTTYDNRIASDTWTIAHQIALTGGNEGLRDRIRRQADALSALAPMLSETELDTPVSARLLSNDTLLVDQPLPLRAIITGLADAELPGHTAQLLALLRQPATAGGRSAALPELIA